MIGTLNSIDTNNTNTFLLVRNNRASLASNASRDSFMMKLEGAGFDLDFDDDLDPDMTDMDVSCVDQAYALFPHSLPMDALLDPTCVKKSEDSEHPVRTVTPTKHEATSTPPPLLHRLCQAFPTNASVIQTALMLEPEAARQVVSLPVLSTSKDSTCGNGKIWSFHAPAFKFTKTDQIKKTKRRDYQYPVNIAINNGASCEVIQILASAAPEVLVQLEGVQGLTTVQIGLQKQPKNHKLVEILLQANPEAAAIRTSHENTLLHLACQRACPLAMVQTIYRADPTALHHRNFHGETPMVLAQRTICCPEDVLNYLQSQLRHRC
jgi:hypothetical protein